jgi:uncharacterized protein (DUF924 family)
MRDGWVDEVHGFWFGALRPRAWFRTDPKLDAEIRRRFLGLWQALKAAPPTLSDAPNAVAAAVVFDQFPRNMFRGTAEAYATDGLALQAARAALSAGLDRGLSDPERQFLYMPFQHSEDRADQQRSVELFSGLAIPGARRTAEAHKALIDRFGRFPHRNAILGRASTPAELEHLRATRSGFEK